MSEWMLDDVRTYARNQAKPSFLYFTTRTAPYYGNQRRLDSLLLNPLVLGVIAHRYVFKIFDRVRGTGIAAASELGINTINPVLVFLTPDGQVAYRWDIATYAEIAPWSAATLANWLDVYADVYSKSSEEVFEAATADPGNLDLQIKAAERSWAQRDNAATTRWLERVDRADTSTRRAVAARAAWQSILIRLDAQHRSTAQDLAREYLQRFPSHGMPAVKLLAATGAGVDEVNAGIVSIVENTVYGPTAQGDDSSTVIDINAVVYDALDLGARESALVAAEAQVRADPGNANGYDTLAQVHAARGAFAEAVSTATEGLRHADEISPIAETLRSTIRDAHNNTASGVGGLGVRQIRESLITVPGEGKLFYDQLPDTRLRCELQAGISELLKTNDALPREVALRVKIGTGGRVEDVQVLTAGLPTDIEADLRFHALELRVSSDAAGLEVDVLAAANPLARNSGCGCR